MLPTLWGGTGSDRMGWKPHLAVFQLHRLPIVILTPPQPPGGRKWSAALLLMEPRLAPSPRVGEHRLHCSHLSSLCSTKTPEHSPRLFPFPLRQSQARKLPSGLSLNEEQGGPAAIWSWEGRCRQEKTSRTDCQVLPQGDNRNNLTDIHWIWPPGETRAWGSCAQEARVWPCEKCSRMRSERGWVDSFRNSAQSQCGGSS